jgi:hypothetical protein
MAEIFDSELIAIIRGPDDYSRWEFGCFYAPMIDLMSRATGHDDDEVFTEDAETMAQEQLKLAGEVHGTWDETGVAHWDTTMNPRPWPGKRLLRPELSEVRIVCGRVKKGSSSSNLPQQ